MMRLSSHVHGVTRVAIKRTVLRDGDKFFGAQEYTFSDEQTESYTLIVLTGYAETEETIPWAEEVRNEA